MYHVIEHHLVWYPWLLSLWVQSIHDAATLGHQLDSTNET